MATGIQSKTGAKSIEQAQRRAEMMRLRLDGMTLDEIGEQMGVQKGTVQRVISHALTSMCKQPADDLRALELARCDELMEEAMQTVRAFHPLTASGKVVHAPVLDSDGRPTRDRHTGEVLTQVVEDKQPKLAAVACALRVMERRAKLLGLDAPGKLETVVSTSTAPAPDLSRFTVAELENIKFKIYGGQPPVAPMTIEVTE